jgi:HK97 gp10 family phage protein
MGAFDFKTEGFTVSGFAEIYENLDGLTKSQKARAIGPLLVKALTPMSLVAISIAPDDPLTGPPWDLKSSIAVSTKQRSGRTNRALGQYGARAYMGPTKYGYPQAIMDEFGTIKMSARPYMRPAWEAGKQGAFEIVKDGFADSVFKAVKKRYFKLR